MKIPTIHLNGTGKDALLDDALHVCQKLKEALDALREKGPNARDYYVQGPDAFTEAKREHQARIVAVGEVFDEYTALALEISNGGAK